MTLISIMLRMGASHNIFQRSDDAEASTSFIIYSSLPQTTEYIILPLFTLQDFSKWDVLREMLLNIFGLGKYHIYSVMYGTGKIINDLLPQSYEDHMRKVKQEIANCLEVGGLLTFLLQAQSRKSSCQVSEMDFSTGYISIFKILGKVR